MNNDLISRSELKKAIEQGEGFSWDSHGKDDLCVRKKYIDNAPTIEINTNDIEYKAYSKGLEDGKKIARSQGECIEVKHRLNLLIGVLYTNQAISKSDLKYIEDSIKKLMKEGGAE